MKHIFFLLDYRIIIASTAHIDYFFARFLEFDKASNFKKEKP